MDKKFNEILQQICENLDDRPKNFGQIFPLLPKKIRGGGQG